eukprot:1235976-Pleurochrysis_carterae.AAC.1
MSSSGTAISASFDGSTSEYHSTPRRSSMRFRNDSSQLRFGLGLGVAPLRSSGGGARRSQVSHVPTSLSTPEWSSCRRARGKGRVCACAR